MNSAPRAGLGRLGDMESENHRFCEEHVQVFFFQTP